MNIPASYQKSVKKEIEDFCKNLDSSPKELYDPIRYMLLLEGKRLRPLLLLLSGKAFKSDLKTLLHAALAVEIFHSFTLMHDDITDNAPLRRNKPTIHVKWNTNIALLSGDAMMIKAYEELVKISANCLQPVLTTFNETAIKVCEGQQLDMNFETQKNVSIEDYLYMIRLKTAALFAASLEMGAVIAGASDKDVVRMRTFGENIGMLFQLQDDILDVFGKQEKVGKQTGGDIIQNKKTYLLLKALELSKGNTLKELKSLLNSRTVSPEKKVQKVKAIYEEVGVLAQANKQMELYCKTAQKAISPIKTPETKILSELLADLMSRQM